MSLQPTFATRIDLSTVNINFASCEFISEQFCEPLGMESGSIPNEAIKASSELDEQHNASRSRLNTKPEGEQMGAWVPLESDENQWLQVDLGKVTRLSRIAVQGEAGESYRHVKEFTVSFSLSGEGFIPYREDGSEKVNCFQLLVSAHTSLKLNLNIASANSSISFPQVFEGNSDQDTVVLNSLKNPVIAQFLRLQPKTWNEGIAMRTEFCGYNAGTGVSLRTIGRRSTRR